MSGPAAGKRYDTFQSVRFVYNRARIYTHGTFTDHLDPQTRFTRRHGTATKASIALIFAPRVGHTRVSLMCSPKRNIQKLEDGPPQHTKPNHSSNTRKLNPPQARQKILCKTRVGTQERPFSLPSPHTLCRRQDPQVAP